MQKFILATSILTLGLLIGLNAGAYAVTQVFTGHIANVQPTGSGNLGAKPSHLQDAHNVQPQ